MDKSWMRLSRVDPRYFEGIERFVCFVRENNQGPTYICPCKGCRLRDWKTLDEIRNHLLHCGIMTLYTTWYLHGEEVVNEGQGSGGGNENINPTLEIINDAFPFREFHGTQTYDSSQVNYLQSKEAHMKYTNLLVEAQKPIYHGCDKTVLGSVLEWLKLKVESRWTDTSFDKALQLHKEELPTENNFPGSYREVKKILKNMGLSYQTIHACENGCVLYYKEHIDLESCPICSEPRYIYKYGERTRSKGSAKGVPKKIVRYFPLTSRLERLYASVHTAKDMRWHGERRIGDGDGEMLRHPADGDAWKKFDSDFPDFAAEIRNVRLGLATDGFCPFGSNGSTWSTWPIVMIPYNLPPSMCMKKEYNMLSMLISGPKSPGKCLNVFMRPLIDELKLLWSTGVPTYDRHSESVFVMRAAVMWTISDFPGLGMVGGIQTKGYKACPSCLNNIDSIHSSKRMCYQGHRRWLPKDHEYRKADAKFRGGVELRERPPSLSGEDVLDEIHRHEFPPLSLHSQFKVKNNTEKLCWTHKSIFYELPYWVTLEQPHSLDVMHIEKNVFDNVFGVILGLDGKKHIWDVSQKSSRNIASFTVSSDDKLRILAMIRDVKYPSGYAGGLRNKIKLEDKRFIGLKTHDCHILLQRVLPVFIRPFLPPYVVNPVIAMCRWFGKICCRELTRSDVMRMKDDIVLILCHFERIFPPSFFTIMVHLMVHLPDQILLRGPVHFTWMYPMERQLGVYKKYVNNPRYAEGSIAEQYIIQECVTYCKLYMDNVESEGNGDQELVRPFYPISKKKISDKELFQAHWCVLENSDEAKYFIEIHKEMMKRDYPNVNEKKRKSHFLPYFRNWMQGLRDTVDFNPHLDSLSWLPQRHKCYTHCEVNGVRFVIQERDWKLKSQNSGVMVETDDDQYFGVLDDVVELFYPLGAPIVVFKCTWFKSRRGRRKSDDDQLIWVNMSRTWFDDSPYCLATNARQVFYLDDPCGSNMKIVNIVNHRGTYDASVLECGTSSQHVVAYQETNPNDIQQIPLESLEIDLGTIPQETFDDEEDDEELDEEEDDDENNVSTEGEEDDEECDRDDGFDDDHE